MSRPLVFRDADGVEYQPVRNFNRATGVSAFRVKPMGASNEAADAIELENIEDLAKAMLVDGLPARVQAVSGGPVNYLKFGAQKLSSYALDEGIAQRIGVPPTSSSLSQADRIRQFVIEHYVSPARERGEAQIELVSGEVHSAMALSNAMPAVCAVLEAPAFAKQAQVTLKDRHSPIGSDRPSSTIRYRFALNGPSLSLDREALERLKQLFLSKHPDFKTFADCESFASTEGDYKRALVSEAQSLLARMQGETDAALGEALIELLAGRAGLESNLVDWRAMKAVDVARQANPGLIESAAGVLARADRPAAAVTDFVDQVWPALSAGLTSKPYAESRIVSTMLRALVSPQDILPVRSTPTDNAARMLFGRAAFTNTPLNTAELDTVMGMAHELRRVMEKEWDWGPRDFWDVQGFIWETCQKRLTALDELDSVPIWLVTSLWGEEDGLPSFVERGEWQLLRDTGSANNRRVREMQVGDRIFLKDFIPRADNLPFDAGGGIVTANRFRAEGTITEVSADGLRVGVDWRELNEPRTWYFYTNNQAVWRLKEPAAKHPSADRLRRFLLNGEEQDYEWFLNNPFWRDRLFGRTGNEMESPMKPTNLILYGPPGTGKTYRTAEEAVRLCDGRVPEDRGSLMERYNELVEAERIGFVTFHQNFSYEEFVEGLRPTQEDEDGNTIESGFRLAPVPGIFSQMAERAETLQVSRTSGISMEGRRFFKMSLGEVANPDDDYLFDEAIEGGFVHLGDETGIDWSQPGLDTKKDMIVAYIQAYPSEPRPHANAGIIDHPFQMRNRFREGDLILVSKGNLMLRAIGEITSEYYEVERESDEYTDRRSVRWLWIDRDGVSYDVVNRKRFSQKTIYELAPSQLKMDALASLLDAGDKGQSTGMDAERKQFVLVIDEINRANISKVFGELITLIEPDKRLGMPNALKVRLPYSKREFGVPANLHIVGTMNTADRSIALLDTALRRRFKFVEMAPDSSVDAFQQAEQATALPLAAVLDIMNQRIEYLVDRDHRIGHAFFIGCETKSDVNAVMRDKVIPLLQEYFFDDWNRLAAVLGEKDKGGNFLTCETIEDPLGEGGEPFKSWRVRETFDDGAYARLVSAKAQSQAIGVIDETATA